MKLEVRRLPIVGAQIVGWDFDKVPAPADVQQLRQLVLQNKVLLFKERVLEPGQLKGFARLFGSQLFVGSQTWWHSPEHREVFRMTNRQALHCGCEVFHCDGHYLADPCGITCTNMVQAGKDAAIAIADVQAAYDSLPDKAKLGFSVLRCHNPKQGLSHPLVIRHPATGRLGLYINRYADAIDHTSKKYPDIDIMLDQVLAQEHLFYKHHWETGDVLVIDNFAVCHRVCSATVEGDDDEVLIRSQTTGQSTWWNQNRNILQPVQQQIRPLQLPQPPQRHAHGDNCSCANRTVLYRC